MLNELGEKVVFDFFEIGCFAILSLIFDFGRHWLWRPIWQTKLWSALD